MGYIILTNALLGKSSCSGMIYLHTTQKLLYVVCLFLYINSFWRCSDHIQGSRISYVESSFKEKVIFLRKFILKHIDLNHYLINLAKLIYISYIMYKVRKGLVTEEPGS